MTPHAEPSGTSRLSKGGGGWCDVVRVDHTLRGAGARGTLGDVVWVGRAVCGGGVWLLGDDVWGDQVTCGAGAGPFDDAVRVVRALPGVRVAARSVASSLVIEHCARNRDQVSVCALAGRERRWA
ncbi:hypothetical protein [Nocardia sp. NPDC049707]|uniref:hypothetical protein n=1 Tax=Nocardia sp. NPDC049707 TaxID=3154735 RepID=UPI0034244EB3